MLRLPLLPVLVALVFVLYVAVVARRVVAAVRGATVVVGRGVHFRRPTPKKRLLVKKQVGAARVQNFVTKQLAARTVVP